LKNGFPVINNDKTVNNIVKGAFGGSHTKRNKLKDLSKKRCALLPLSSEKEISTGSTALCIRQ